jgi:hypothetical protein
MAREQICRPISGDEGDVKSLFSDMITQTLDKGLFIGIRRRIQKSLVDESGEKPNADSLVASHMDF